MIAAKLTTIVRSFSTTKFLQKMIKPPVKVFGMEGRYAAALYSAASKENKLDTVEKELTEFQQKMKEDETLRDFIINPTIKRKLKAEAFKGIAEKLSLSSLTSNLLIIMAENGRLKVMNGIINSFKMIMSAHRSEVTCEVISAKPLEDGQKVNLEAILKTFLKGGETILLKTKIDPQILGGLIVSIGDRYVDMSIASRMNKYSEILRSSL